MQFDLTIDHSLENQDLYLGTTIETVAGRKNLTSSIPAAVEVIGANINKIVSEHEGPKNRVLLTGGIPVWGYLVTFHAVVHKFSEVWYSDGRNEPVLIAAHGSVAEESTTGNQSAING